MTSMSGNYLRPRPGPAPAPSSPRGPMLASRVRGSPGQWRWEVLQNVPSALTLTLIVPTICLAMAFPLGVVITPVVLLTVLTFLLYNLFVPGPWRYFDVSPPVHFELGLDSIEVARWEPVGCPLRRTKRSWGAAEIEAVNVYTRTEVFKGGFPSCCCRRRAAAAVEQPGPAEVIENGTEAHAKVPAWFSPFQLLFGSQRRFNCFFLGLQLHGATDVIPISRHAWTHEGLQELLDLCNKVHLFQDGELLVEERSDPWAKAPNTRKIAAPVLKRRYSTTSSEDTIADEAPEMDVCAICLENFHDGDHVNLLPCGHIFHCACTMRWLTISKHCPMCKQKVSSGSLAVPPGSIRPCVAESVELRPLGTQAASTEPEQPHPPCTVTCV